MRTSETIHTSPADATPFRTAISRFDKAGWSRAAILPGIPPGAELTEASKVKPEQVGKIPGFRRRDGKWTGLSGGWATGGVDGADRSPGFEGTLDWPTGQVCILGHYYPAIDADVISRQGADLVKAALLFFEVSSGEETYRTRDDGSERFLLPYRTRRPFKAWPPIRFRLPGVEYADGVWEIVELKASGYQWLAAGRHPSGASYQWTELPDARELPELDEHSAAALRAALLEELSAADAEIETKSAGSLSVTGSAQDVTAREPMVDHVTLSRALTDTPNTPETTGGWDGAVSILASMRYVLGSEGATPPDYVYQWAEDYPGEQDPREWLEGRWESLSQVDTTEAPLLRYIELYCEDHNAYLALQRVFDRARVNEAFDDESEAAEGWDDLGLTPFGRVLDEYVYITRQRVFWHLPTATPHDHSGFKARHTEIASFGDSGKNGADAKVIDHPQCTKVYDQSYEPGKPQIIRRAGRSYLNTWRPGHIVANRAATEYMIRPWLDHARQLIPDAVAREHVLDWMAYIVQHPGKKINHAIVITGGQGVGKDSLIKPLLTYVGENEIERWNVSQVTNEMLQSQYNPWIESQIIVVQEMSSRGRRELYNSIKHYLANPPATVPVNNKFTKVYYVPNIQNWYITSNHDDAIALEYDDRRNFVYRSPSKKPDPEYFVWLYQWFANEDNVAAVAGWLAQRDLSKFNPAAAPPMTAAKSDMARSAMSPAGRWICSLFDDDGPFAGRAIVAPSEVHGYAHLAYGADDTVRSSIGDKAIKAAFEMVGGQAAEARYRIGGERVRPWVFRRHDSLLGLESTMLKAMHEKERADGGAREDLPFKDESAAGN